ncbi:MAG: (2Fe-2S)-binding protein [Mariniphaga sp.]|nr:(2Fe-2S)-binding protein [Mariniphaga sp.]
MKSKLVCLCSLVTEDEIKDVLKKGASSTTEIQEYTRAGTTCGRCLPEIDQLVEYHNKKNKKGPQLKKDF